MTDDCMGCREPGYSHAAYCPESRVEDLRKRLTEAEHDIARAMENHTRDLARLAEAERKLKNYEPTNLYNGLTIDQWKARCDEAEALLREARACLYMVQDDQIAADIDAFLAADSGDGRNE